MRGIPQWSAERVREFIADHPADSYNLVDVRQPVEYEQEHLPGAELMPLDALMERIGELDRRKPTIVYCRSGNRSGAAVAVMINAGFPQVYNLDGGLMGYYGKTAFGMPDTGDAFFADADDLGEMIARAWSLEEGARRFYEAAAERLDDEAAAMFQALAVAEVQHKDFLEQMGEKLLGDAFALPQGEAEMMEGGVPLEVALQWIEGKAARETMEFALALETVAYDRYIHLAKRAEDPEAKKLFASLAEGERAHLKQILEVFEPRL